MKYKLKPFSRRCLAFGLTVYFVFLSGTVFPQTYLNSKASVESRVQDLLSRMTLDEKIGQMVQTERNFPNVNSVITNYFLGSVLSGGGSSPGNSALDWIDMYNSMQRSALATRLKIPIIYGIDAVHGDNNLYGATIFPHNIGMGCTRDTVLVEKCAAATAMEVRATGLNWTFSPCVAVARDIRWGRTYESFGETPDVVKMMAGPSVRGYQGDTLGTPNHILACAKHFVADGGTLNGVNAGNAVISLTTLRNIHLPGYVNAIQAGVGSIMVSFSKWNGTYCHANQYLITYVLKGELGFKGLVVSDWEGIANIAGNFKTCVKLGVNAGIDMFMEPNRPIDFINDLKELVNEDSVSIDRINDAVSRILTVKFKLGLFEHPYATNALVDSIGSPFHRQLARQAVRESLVLLKNDGAVLPLSKVSGKILVAGEKANDLGVQCGGWTIWWQGGSGAITKGTTILQAIQNVRGSSQVIYSSNGTTAATPNVAVVVVGESPYAESAGDNTNPTLSTDDLQTIANVKNLGIPYVILLISGRPLMLGTVLDDAPSVVACWLPGTEGEGITDVLFGDYDFTGKLSQTWPTSIAQEPINWGDESYQPLFPYGYGLNDGVTGTSTLKSPSFTLYPNPAMDYIDIRSAHGGSLEIYNIHGMCVLKASLDEKQQNIKIDQLDNGIYIVKFTSKSGKISVSKFIKQGS